MISQVHAFEHGWHCSTDLTCGSLCLKTLIMLKNRIIDVRRNHCELTTDLKGVATPPFDSGSIYENSNDGENV